MADTIYKLPLDEMTDKDLIAWINSLPRNKKAEVVRHALRFYKSQLKEGETFIMPSATVSQDISTPIIVEEKKPSGKKPVGLRHITKVQE